MRLPKFPMAKFVTLLLVALLGLSVTAQETHELVILHDTHFHGKFGPEDGPNIARYAALIEQLKDGRDNVLFVGNGDDLAPSLHSSVFGGGHIIEALNAMGLDVNTPGNHEFDFGPENFLEQVENSNFPWVSANVIDNRTGHAFGAEVGVSRFVIIEMPSGLRVGFTGFAPAETPEIASPGPHAMFLDPVESGREVVAMMRQAGADVTIALSHLCWPASERVAEEVDGLTAIVGDHCSEVLEEPEVIGDTIVSRVGDEFDFLGELTLSVSNGEVTGFDFVLHELTEEMDEHPGVAAIVADYEDQLEAALDDPVGESTTDLDVRRSAVRSEETNIGNLIADAAREWAGADVALQNGGGIRADRIIEAGPLTRRDIVDTLPFENYVVKFELSGAELLEAIEHGVSTVEEGHGRFPQVSGMRYTFDANAEPGSRVTELLVAGEPVDPDASYSLATVDFIARGGDGYEMFADKELIISADEGILLSTLLEMYVSDNSPVGPEVEGRITRLD